MFLLCRMKALLTYMCIALADATRGIFYSVRKTIFSIFSLPSRICLLLPLSLLSCIFFLMEEGCLLACLPATPRVTASGKYESCLLDTICIRQGGFQTWVLSDAFFQQEKFCFSTKKCSLPFFKEDEFRKKSSISNYRLQLGLLKCEKILKNL